MKKKIIGFLTILILLFICLALVFINIDTGVDAGAGGRVNVRDIADDYSYGSVPLSAKTIDTTYRESFNNSWWFYPPSDTTMRNGFWGYNVICVEGFASDSLHQKEEDGYYVAAVVDIEADGSGKVYSYDGTVNSFPASDDGKDMAYLAYIATEIKSSGSGTPNLSDPDYGPLYGACKYVWGNFGATVSGASSASIPNDSSGGNSGDLNNFKNDATYKKYYGGCKARLVFASLHQSKLFLFGEPGTPSEVKIDKYIDKASDSSKVDGTIGDGRKEKENTWKQSNKPVVQKDVELTYKITLKNTGTSDVKDGIFTDTPADSSKMEVKEVKLKIDGGTEETITDWKTGHKIEKLEAGKTATITVKIKVLEANEESYENKATFKYDSEEITSSDYYTGKKGKKDVTINKYITSINPATNADLKGNRSTMDEGEKASNPAEIKVKLPSSGGAGGAGGSGGATPGAGGGRSYSSSWWRRSRR